MGIGSLGIYLTFELCHWTFYSKYSHLFVCLDSWVFNLDLILTFHTAPYLSALQAPDTRH